MKACVTRVFFFSLSRNFDDQLSANLHRIVILSICWDTQSEKTGLWQLPMVVSVFIKSLNSYFCNHSSFGSHFCCHNALIGSFTSKSSGELWTMYGFSRLWKLRDITENEKKEGNIKEGLQDALKYTVITFLHDGVHRN